MTPDHNRAAAKAAETLIRYGIKSAPVSPLPILSQMDNVITVSFADLGTSSGISKKELAPLFGKNRDAVTSAHTKNGETIYVVAYDSMLPFSMIQRALAREMGHIVLKHDGNSCENMEEATTFSHHLLCPRPLIHAIQATGMRITVDLLANLTGIYDQCLLCMRRTPETKVPIALNRFVRTQFMPFIINFFEFYQSVLPDDGSALADFGTFMDGYEE